MKKSAGNTWRSKTLAVLMSGFLACAGSFGIVSMQAIAPSGAIEMAAASDWSDSIIKRIDALPSVQAVTLANKKEVAAIMSAISSRYANGTLTEEEGLAIGSERISKLEELDNRIGDLEQAAEKAKEAAVKAKIRAYKKSKVKGVKVVAKKRKATISWKKLTNTNSNYEIYVSTKKNKGYKLVKYVPSSKTKASVTGLKKGKRYYFKVRAASFFDADLAYSKPSFPVLSKKIK